MVKLPGLGEVYMSGENNTPIKKTRRTWQDALPDECKVIEAKVIREPEEEIWIDDTEVLADSSYQSKKDEQRMKEQQMQEMRERLKARREIELEQAMKKASPTQIPTEESDEVERLEYFRRTKKQIGTFSESTIINEFLEYGSCLGTLPKSLLTLSAEAAGKLRRVNPRSYEFWLKAGGKLEEETPYLRFK